MITWPQNHYARLCDGDFLQEFEELAQKEEPLDPVYPIVYFHPD